MNARRTTIGCTSVIAVLIALILAGRAQEPARLTLSEAVQRAVSTDPLLNKADVNVRIAGLRVDEARATRKPFVRLTQSFTNSNNPVFVFGSLLEQGRFTAANFALNSLNNPKPLSNFRTTLDLRLPLYDKGLSRIATSRAEIARSHAELAAEVVRQALIFNVVKNYYALVLAGELCKVNEDAVRSAEANLKKNSDYLEAGLIVGSDVLSSEVELSGAKQRQLEALADRRTTSAAFNIQLGLPIESGSEVTGDLRERYFPLATVSDLLVAAMEHRPEMRQAELAIENGRKFSQSVRSERKPSVDAYANYGYSSPYIANGSTDYTVGVSVAIDLFKAGRKSREAEAAEQITAAQLDKQALVDRVRLEVVKAYESHVAARSKIQVSITSIRQAEEANRIIHDRYGEGLTTFNEVLRAESMLTKAKHDLLNARYEYLISYASLLLATGQLNDVSLFE